MQLQLSNSNLFHLGLKIRFRNLSPEPLTSDLFEDPGSSKRHITQFLKLRFCSVDCLSLEPPPPMMELVGRVPTERANTRWHYSWRLRGTEWSTGRSTGQSTGRLTLMPLKMKVEAKAHNPRKKQQKCRCEADVVLVLQDDYRLHLNCVKEHQEVGVSCDAHGEARVLVTSQSRKAH